MTCLYMHVSSRKKESLQGMMFVLFLTFCFQSLKWCKWQAGIETVWIHAYKQPIWRRQQNTLLRWIIWIKFQTQKMYDAGSWQCYGYIHMYIYIYIYTSLFWNRLLECRYLAGNQPDTGQCWHVRVPWRSSGCYTSPQSLRTLFAVNGWGNSFLAALEAEIWGWMGWG